MAAGRFFSDEFSTDMTESLVLNEAAVRAMGISSPIGKKITIGRQTYVCNWNNKGFSSDFPS